VPYGDRGTGELVDRSMAGGLAHAAQIIRSIWGWLVFGIVASAAITVLVPADIFATIGLSGPWASVLVLLIALPLYVCAVASVPLAAGLVAAGMPVSAALVFLMAGPATNLATMGAIAQGFGRRVLAIYLAVLVVGSLGAAWLFEAWFPGQTLTGPAHMEHTAWWETASAWVLLTLLLGFATDDLRRRLRGPVDATVELPVEGLTCGGCVRRLEGVLGGVDGITAVEVQLTPGRARITGTASASTVRAAIEGAGFRVP
jgi:copper chaperone CopZ